MYKQGKNLNEISQETSINRSTVYKILKDLKVTMRPQHQVGHSKNTTKNRKYHFNLDFFETIDTEEKAYWLGFLYADGYVSHTGYIRIALQEQDLEHIKKFRTAIEANEVTIKHNQKTKSYSIDCCSIKMARDLAKKGCFQNKSLTLTFPIEDIVPNHLIHHFMRGYFDGDGCISGTKTPSFSVLGTKDFLDKYEDILINNIKCKKNKRIHKKHGIKTRKKLHILAKKQNKYLIFYTITHLYV